ncbi:hypothetical protein BZA70DRAFT_287200 [Myxozyma melibiosi]|uniref:MARVEL domain-containing protein n=1 Tax=Myxozyma melibiosi TaxID=54550 RepID=A0ABR1FDC9_9ASCO
MAKLDLNRLILYALRAAQLVFSVIILADISYQVQVLQRAGSTSFPAGYVVTMVACCLSLLTIGICLVLTTAGTSMWKMFIWDIILAILFAVAFVVTLEEIKDSIDYCTWDQLNPFTANDCPRLRAAMIFSLVLAGLWALNAAYRIMVRQKAPAPLPPKDV